MFDTGRVELGVFERQGVHSNAFFTDGGTVRPMPIRPEHRFFYPIDWAQISVVLDNFSSYFTILQPQLELA